MANSKEGAGRASPVTSLRELEREIQPSRDLWSDIKAQLPAAGRKAKAADPLHRSAFGLRVSWTQAAALAAGIAVLAFGIWIGHGIRPSHEIAKESIGTDAPAMLRAAFITDSQYLRERADLLRSLPARIAALPPESQKNVTASLATIHKAMQDIETALGRDSSNALLQELLINTRQDEMRVLTAVYEASNAGERI